MLSVLPGGVSSKASHSFRSLEMLSEARLA